MATLRDGGCSFRARWRRSPALCFLVLILPALIAPAAAVDLAINEFMASNTSAVQDEWGDFDDWFEIHNFGATQVNIEGMFVSDNHFFPTVFELPDLTLQPGESVVIWCDIEQNEGPLHANFQLDGDGEQLGLYDTLFNGNAVIDTLTFCQQIPDVSSGRLPDGTGGFFFMGDPTPGGDNGPLVNVPPFPTDTDHFPANPTSEETVEVITEIIEDFNLADARLFYDAGGGFIEVPFAPVIDGGFCSGYHYSAIIPSQLDGTFVDYYVWAEDDSGAVATNPPGAPGTTFTYEVGYVLPSLFVNEFMASNSTVIQDEWGDFEDWAEIYNAGAEAVDLTGLKFTDNLDNPDKFIFPDTTIAAGGFLLIWCDDEAHEGPLHTPFKLSASGEELGIFTSALHGTIQLDSIAFGPQTTDVSFGRQPDGADNWIFFESSTPGESNNPTAVAETDGIISLRVLGAYPNPVRTGTRIRFELPDSRDVVLRVFSADGREVSRPVSALLHAGEHALGWDGRDAAGRPVASGVYLYEISAGTERAFGKLLRVR
jgi:hypothetical protein